MKKFRILPLIAIATLGGMTLPLVSCKKGGDEPEPKPIDPLCFMADGEDSTVSYDAHTLTVGVDGDVDIEVSTDKTNWSKWKVQEGTTLGQVLTINDGQKLYIRNTKNTLSTNYDNRFQFVMDGKISASGNVNSMINYGELSKYCFVNLFTGCTSLTTAPELPATTLADRCYLCMFLDCTSLETAPELPATTLANSCYSQMFNNCESLKNVPSVLPAIELADGCYSCMFQSCSSLETPPDLPAQTLKYHCYSDMFSWCSSLIYAPSLPATTLEEASCREMFRGCSTLKVSQDNGTNLIVDFTDVDLTLENCVDNMFQGAGGEFQGTPTNAKYFWN